VALALGARSVPGWSPEEELIANDALPVDETLVDEIARTIRAGEDPLGDSYCELLNADMRRPKGQTYTPRTIVDAMLGWSAQQVTPQRVVDPGAGSARFLVAAGRRFPHAELIAIELDPPTAILARGHLAAAGLNDRAVVKVCDYRNAALKPIDGRTLFLGNPPYVRHHLIDSAWKMWLVATARAFGYKASQLAGLHVHFFLATAQYARPGDVGVLITAAEWLDVNYGRLVRDLLLGVLGAENIQVIEPSAEPFLGTQTTAVITCFDVGSESPTIGLRRVAALEELGLLPADIAVRRERLEAADRWTPLTRPVVGKREGLIELGELCRVHRGQVTGANRVWIADTNEYKLPESVLFPSVTRARELFAVGQVLDDVSRLKLVIDLPVDLHMFESAERRRIQKFLRYAKSQGAHEGFIARHRKAWWSVGLREPAPILATYMARRPPVFIRNSADARHINIAHGLYPRQGLTEYQLRYLATFLSESVSLHEGRTYAGGLTKFEPREMERLLVPHPDVLRDPSLLEQLV
jgi:hypothetical protein